MDHQNSNSSNTAARFARPMESGDNVDRTNGNTFSFVTQKIHWCRNNFYQKHDSTQIETLFYFLHRSNKQPQ